MRHENQTHDERVTILVSGARLEGDLSVPAGARGLVLFAHGSGSSRRSPRNRFVAQALRERQLGTILFDLLTSAEERRDAVEAHMRFDIPLLALRLGEATDWVRRYEPARGLPIGYFGASTGGAAALMAAAARSEMVGAVVSRGGRPDLAGGSLTRVQVPSLFIVGGADAAVLDLTREALERMSCPRELAVVPQATHLFEEPGALEEVARLAGDWFVRYLGAVA